MVGTRDSETADWSISSPPFSPSYGYQRRRNLSDPAFRCKKIELSRGIPCVLNFKPYSQIVEILTNCRRNRRRVGSCTNDQNIYCRLSASSTLISWECGVPGFGYTSSNTPQAPSCTSHCPRAFNSFPVMACSPVPP